ncbi:MAG: LLM class flavin-dependent oxidoreductase [Deltaproteobacteria bacterium]|nr:LLM class flavin-dependent oxidoreductase [Deltaproteobacteria bacterium]MBW2362151.1 LLM class flavin-dependent oxidoreductase [Deltaproteobacteria bacterium]
MSRIRFGVIYDFRKMPGSALSMPDIYANSLDQAERVDDLGFDHIWLTEHHFVEDGYLPSPLAVSGALAARTRNVMLGQDVLLLPHYHPVRLAEDLAVLDNLSRGRMMLGVGMGYVPAEFAALGSHRKQRLSRMEEGLDILELAWQQERFDYEGKRYQLSDVRVRPRPVQEGGPPTWIAAMSEAGALRAARRGAHLLPQGDRAAVLDPYLARVDRAAEERRIGIVRPFYVTEDPDLRAAFQQRASAFSGDSHIAKLYREWFAQIDDAMTRQLEEGEAHGRTIPQSFFAGTPDECIAELEAFAQEFGVTDVILAGWGTSAGDDPTESTANLERFAKEVMPHFS